MDLWYVIDEDMRVDKTTTRLAPYPASTILTLQSKLCSELISTQQEKKIKIHTHTLTHDITTPKVTFGTKLQENCTTISPPPPQD